MWVPARVLSANPIVGEDGKPRLELQVQAEIEDFDLHHLDRDNLEAFILTYRMLTQNNDRYSIARLADSYEFVHPFFRGVFKNLRQQIALFLSTGSSLQPNGVAITYRDILDIVIYGELAHSNKQKAATFQRWTRWPAHEKMLWFVFDHALRCSMSILQHCRDLNAATLMAHFAVPVQEEAVFRRLQEKGILSAEAIFPLPNAS